MRRQVVHTAKHFDKERDSESLFLGHQESFIHNICLCCITKSYKGNYIDIVLALIT